MTVPVVAAATSKLESRFVVNGLVPTLVFLPLIFATLLHAAFGMPSVLSSYIALPPALLVLVPLALVALAWLVAALLATQWDRLVTIYEGYPLESLYRWIVKYPVIGLLADAVYIPGKMAHQRRRERFVRDVNNGLRRQADLHLAYPENPEHVLPTRLGNIVRAAELYPYARYGIDFTILWTRLAMLLPEHLLRDVERSIMQYQLPLVISAWASALALASLALAITGYFWHFAAVYLASMGVAVAAYYWSLRSAENFGLAVRSVFDLYRDALHAKWPKVMSAHVEREDFDRLQRFIVSGTFDRSSNAVPPLLSEGEGSDQASSAPQRTPRWKPSLLPTLRLSLLAVLGGLLVIILAWLYANRIPVNVAIAAHDANPYHQLRASTTRMSLYDAGGLRAKSGTGSAGALLLAMDRVESGEILTIDEYIELDGSASTVFQFSQPEYKSNKLALQVGDTVSLVFHGSADFESDPECLRRRGAGIGRLVRARILMPPDRSGVVVVGAGADARLAFRCFGVRTVDLVKNP